MFKRILLVASALSLNDPAYLDKREVVDDTKCIDYLLRRAYHL
jgi:hypothetical protein